MLTDVKNGQTSVVLRVKLRDSSVATGAGLTGLTFSSSGLRIGTIADNESAATAYTAAASTIETITTLGTYAAPTATKCRFKEVDATNHPGVYEIQLADARFAVASAKGLLVSISGATNLAQCDVLVPLRGVDPYDGVRGGLTALPNAAAAAAGGLFTRGTGAGQINQDANGRIDVNAVAAAGTAWNSGAVTSATLGTGAITAGAIAADAIGASELAADGVAEIAAAVWDLAVSGHTTGGSFGAAMNAAGSAGDPWNTSLPGSYVAGSAGYVVGHNIDVLLSSRLAPTTAGRTLDVSATGEAGLDFDNVKQATAPTTLSNLTVPTVTTAGTVSALGTQAKQDVNAEVVDCLAVDAYAEVGQEGPAATTTLRKMLGYLYKAWRNKKTQTSSQYSLFADDATTVDQKATVSDDGATTTVGEVATGP